MLRETSGSPDWQRFARTVAQGSPLSLARFAFDECFKGSVPPTAETAAQNPTWPTPELPEGPAHKESRNYRHDLMPDYAHDDHPDEKTNISDRQRIKKSEHEAVKPGFKSRIYLASDSGHHMIVCRSIMRLRRVRQSECEWRSPPGKRKSCRLQSFRSSRLS